MEFTEVLKSSLDFILFTIPILLPIGFGYLLFNIWVDYARTNFMASQDHVLLKIIPPKEILKTPVAMELFLNSLYQTGGESTPLDRLWKGKVRAWFSLEIISTGGEVGFYIWTRKALSGYIQSQIYAQFPGIEVFETEDYTFATDYFSGDYSMFGGELELTQPDPVPIKTFVDYGLDSTSTKEEQKTDPISATLEYLGSIRKGESVWIQIIVRAHKKEDKDPTKWFGKTDRWQDEAKELILKIKKDAVYKDEKSGSVINLSTKGQQDKINAIERSISKLGFDTGIRLIYIADRDIFNGVNNGVLVGLFKQYGSSNLNGFKPRFTTSFDYWWQDPWGTKVEKLRRNVFESYIERDYFWKALPKGKPRKKFILNSEELATIFHFPSQSTLTPSLGRVDSRKGEPPANLPI